MDGHQGPAVEIYTGKDDQILRRMVVDLASRTRLRHGGHGRARLSITDVNEDQDISAPADAKPFDELLSQLGGLGALGGRRLVLGGGVRLGRRLLGAPRRTSRSTPSA